MPDRFGDNPEPLDVPDREWASAHRAMLIAHCELCDDEGRRGAILCDHVDRTETYARGMDLVRAKMGWS